MITERRPLGNVALLTIKKDRRVTRWTGAAVRHHAAPSRRRVASFDAYPLGM